MYLTAQHWWQWGDLEGEWMNGAAVRLLCGVPWQRAHRGHGQIPPGIRATCVLTNIRLTHLVLSVCVCVHITFHALFSPSLCEAGPSVSKFICHTSSGLVWSRERLHILFMSLTAEAGLGRCVFVCLFTYVLGCLLYHDSVPSCVCLHYTLLASNMWKVWLHTYLCVIVYFQP